MNKSLLTISLSLSSLLIGCGGGGVSAPRASISLGLSKSTLTYGESVTLSWTSQGVRNLTSQTSFPVSSSQVNGSMVDRPATSTTYVVTGVDDAGNEVSATIAVSVARIPSRFLLVGDQSLAGVTQIASFLKSLSGLDVATSLTLPTPIDADVVVILRSANVGPADHAAVQSYLSAGGRVVIVGRAANKLATGNELNPDVSAIGSWFAGATSSEFSLTAIFSVPGAPGIPLSAIHYNRELISDVTTGPVSADAVLLTTSAGAGSGGFVYKTPSGGKVGFVGGMAIDSTVSGTATRGVFYAVCRWAGSGL